MIRSLSTRLRFVRLSPRSSLGLLGLLSLALSLSLALPAAAATVEYRALLDLDNDPGTGCSVLTVDGSFDGVEQILTTTVETLPLPGEVTGLVRQECDPMAGTFGAPIVVNMPQAPPWPVGLGNGTLGSDVVETYFPLGAVGAALPIRIGLESDDLGGNNDALLEVLLADEPGVPEIPTLSTWALLGLALLLVTSALWRLRLRRRGVMLLVLLAAGSVAGGVWAVCVLDGEVDDWQGVPALGTDPLGDAPADTDLVALFARDDGTELCLRYDVEINQPPMASADNYFTEEDSPLNISAPGVLSNDTDPNGDMLTAVLDMAPPGAEVTAFTLNPDGSFDLTPAADFAGTTSFTYHANDGALDSNTVTVTVTVGPLPDGPMAVPDSFATDEDTVLSPVASVLDNDVDPENDPLEVTAFDGMSVQGATVTVNPDGTFTYDPTGAANLQNLAAGAMLDDTFTYTVEDIPSSGSDVGTVTVTVTGVDDPPVAVDDMATVTEDSMGNVLDVLVNDTDIDGGPLQITSVTQPLNGTVSNNTTDLSYEPDLDYCNDPPGTSTDDFTYTINGGSIATVRVTVTCVDDPGVANTDTYRTVGNTLLEVSASQVQPLPSIFVLGSVLANDSDPDNALTVTGTAGITAGAVVNMNADGTFTYVPPPGLHGDGNPATADDTFQYQLSGGELGTVQIDIDGFVWYVDNTANGGAVNTGAGTSVDRFSTLSDGGANADPDDADDASIAGDTVYVFQGDGTNTNQDNGYAMNDNQRLLGEGVDLVVDVNGTPTTLFTGNAANKPLLQPTSGVAVAFNNSSGEVAGLDIRGGNGVTVVPGGGTSVVIRDNDITGLGGLTGLLVDHNNAGTLDLAVLRNTIGGTRGVDVTNTLGTLNVVFDQNTGLESTDGGATAAASFSAAAGLLAITSFNANQVAGTTASAGLVFDGVEFDTTPGDGNFTGDEVSAGNLAVGSMADPVSGSALVLTDVAGDLAFGTLDLFTNGVGAVGLSATGNGTLNAGAGTGFEITNTGGTINSVNGPAVDMDPLTAGMTFASVSSGSSPMGVHAIRLHDLAGSFTASGGTLANSLGSAIRVTGTNPGDSTIVVNLSNMTVNHAAGLTPVIFGQNSTGMLSLTNSTVNKGGGRVLEFDDMDGGSSFTGTTVNSANHHGKSIIDSAGVHNLPNIQITTAPPAGINALHLVNNVGATINVPRLEVTTNGSRGIFANNGGTLNVTGATNQVTTTGSTAIEMSNTTVGGSGMTFSSISATSTGANEGLDLDGVGGGTFQVTGTTTVNGTGAGQSGMDLATSGATFTFSSVDIDNTGGAGVALTNNTGVVTLSGGDISGSGGNAFDVDQGAANVTYGGTINNGAARAVEVTNRAGGTVSLTGAVVDTGATNSGILLDNNDAGTVELTGTVDITGTSGAGVSFQSSNGGTASFADLDIDNSGTNQTALFATGNTGGGTLNVTTGTVHGGTAAAADLDNTVLGVTLFSATSIGGAAVGIDLANTTGSFTVTGDGATGGAGLFADNNGSGGAITGKSGNAVRLATVTNVSLNYMSLSSNSGSGIHGTEVNGFVLTRSNLLGNGDAVDESGLRFGLPDGSQNGLIGTGLAGANPTRLSHVDISGSSEHNVEIINTTGVLTDLLVENSRFRDTGAPLGADGFLAEMRSTAVGTINVAGSTFSGNATQGLQGSAIDMSTLTVNVTGSTFTGNNEGLVLSTSGGGDLNFDISNNPAFTAHDGVAIFVGTTSSATAGSILTGQITNNPNIQTPATGVNHSVIVFPSGSSKMVALVSNNVIDNDGLFRGINVTTTDNVGDDPDLDVTLTNNTVMNAATADHAILVEGRNSASVCAKIEGNTSTAASATRFGIRFRERDSSTVELEAGGSASADPATVLSDNNPASVGFSVTGAPAVVANGTCEQVP